MDHVLGFLEASGCLLLFVTYLVVLRAVAHAKRPDADARERTPAAPKQHPENAVASGTAKSVA